MDKVFGEEGFADSVGSYEHDVGGVFEPLEPEEIVDLGAVDFLGPVSIKVTPGFEGAEPSLSQSSLESSLSSSLFLPVEDLG